LPEQISLSAAFGKHAIGQILRSGEVSDPRVSLDMVQVDPIHKAFAPMVKEQTFDVSEMAIVTALQAIAFGHPVALLPVVVAGRFQRGCIVAPADRPITDPATQLRGAKVGVRSYTQTTGLWVRTHLTEDFGLAAQDMRWFTQNPAHVPEYVEPDYVSRTLEGSLVDALRNGDIDAAIFGNDLPQGDEFVPVIDHAAERDQAWYDSHGYVPVNHLVTVKSELLETKPDAVRRVWDMLVAAESLAGERATGISVTMAGLEKVSAAIADIAASSHDQGMLPRPLSADEIFGPVARLLA